MNSDLRVIILIIIITSLTSICIAASPQLAPVSGFARSFLLGRPIANAKITIIETGMQITTDKNGRFGPFLYVVGKPITLLLQKRGFKTTQSGTQIVTRSGLIGSYHNISFQVPSIPTYYLIAALIGAKLDDDSCHVTTTVTAYHKTLYDIPQGEPNAQIVLIPKVNTMPFYFDIFKTRLLKDKTNPFTRSLTSTSLDGGVAFFNLPPRLLPYTLSAKKAGYEFSKAHFLCRKGVFINVSPPQGPSIIIPQN